MMSLRCDLRAYGVGFGEFGVELAGAALPLASFDGYVVAG